MGAVISCFDAKDSPTGNSNRSGSVHVTLTQRKEIVHRREVQVVPSPQTQISAAEVLGACTSGLVHPDKKIPTGYQSSQQGANGMKPSAPSECYIEFKSSEDEDVCPTCLEDYDSENPKIVTKCSHHFHLACIYEWMERSHECPVCFRVMEFDEPA